MMTKSAALELARQRLRSGHYIERHGLLYVYCPRCGERVDYHRGALDRRTESRGLRETLAEHLREWCESDGSR